MVETLLAPELGVVLLEVVVLAGAEEGVLGPVVGVVGVLVLPVVGVVVRPVLGVVVRPVVGVVVRPVVGVLALAVVVGVDLVAVEVRLEGRVVSVLRRTAGDTAGETPGEEAVPVRVRGVGLRVFRVRSPRLPVRDRPFRSVVLSRRTALPRDRPLGTSPRLLVPKVPPLERLPLLLLRLITLLLLPLLLNMSPPGLLVLLGDLRTGLSNSVLSEERREDWEPDRFLSPNALHEYGDT